MCLCFEGTIHMSHQFTKSHNFFPLIFFLDSEDYAKPRTIILFKHLVLKLNGASSCHALFFHFPRQITNQNFIWVGGSTLMQAIKLIGSSQNNPTPAGLCTGMGLSQVHSRGCLKHDYELCKCQCGSDWRRRNLFLKLLFFTIVFGRGLNYYHFLWAPGEPHGEGNSYDIEFSNESQIDV